MASFGQQLSLTACLFVVLSSLVSSELLCEDKTKSCTKWSEKKRLCDENTKYKKQRFFVSMSRLCKKSCLMCGDDDASLFDTDSRCNSYFRKGYCEMKPHQGFMLRRCKYSCRNTIRSGIMSPGRGNFQRNNPPVQDQKQAQQNKAGYWNQQQADYRYPQQYGQQYAQQYAQQYGQQYAQNGQQQAQNGQQNDQHQAQNYGQQQYPQQYAQQHDAQTQTAGQQQQQAAGQQQTADQQQPQAQQHGGQSLADLPVQVQALSNPQVPSRKHKLEKKRKHHSNDDMDDDDDVGSDDDMD